MNRRGFIGGLVVAAITAEALAQQTSKVYHIAFVDPVLPAAELSEASSDPSVAQGWRVFFEELRRLRYVEGQNLVVERYSGEGRPEHFRVLAGDVVRRNPDVIYAFSPDLLLAFKAATTTIPIVGLTGDPVALGIVSSLARPGGNITGVSVDAGIEIWGKRLDLLREAIPRLSRLGFLLTATRWGIRGAAPLKEASENQRISLVGSPLDSPIDETAYRRAFAAMAQEGADAVFVGDEPEHFYHLGLIAELAQEGRLPSVFAWRYAVEIGGLLAYSFDALDLIRRIAREIDQILKGTKLGDIPFYQASKFELVVNLKTAKALGLTIPPSLLARADEVIE